MGNQLVRLPLIGEVKVTWSVVASLGYSFVSLVIFVVVCAYGWKRLKERADADEIRGIKKYTQWFSLVWKMKSIYLSALVHIYDVCTDVGIIVLWAGDAFKEVENKNENNVRELDMMALFMSSLVAFFCYRFVSAGFVYEFTGKWKRACIQFLDLEIYHAIYITHKLGREEAGNLQRWLQKFEAIFESAPQSLLQIVYIIKTGDRGWLIMSSITLSFFSVAARFTSDDRIFFVKQAERLGLKFQRRFPKKNSANYARVDDDDDNSDIDDDEELLNESMVLNRATTSSPRSKKGENDDLEAKEEYPSNEQSEKRMIKDTNPNIQIRKYEPTYIKFRYIGHQNGKHPQYTKCKHQTAKVYNKSSDTFLWSTKVVEYEPRSNEYIIKGLESATDYVLRLSFRTAQGKWTKWTDNKAFKTPLFTRWKLWNYIGFNRAYLFRYSFRMCDVFSRLMILALIWCVLSGTITAIILAFEIITVVAYAQQIKKYNFFQFLVATYFSEDNRRQTVSYCFFRRIESLVYLCIVSYFILYDSKYNDDITINCVDAYGSGDAALAACTDDVANSYANRKEADWCDCYLQNEIETTKLLFILAWAFANLSGDVFFGAFNSMRQKFGTNERNIVNVMEKRDWEAFSEMLQFGYRMNRFDERSQRSGLSTFLDRVPSHKFQYEEVERMIFLGANINDVSIKPKDEKDRDEPQKVGDNVLIRYIKVTPCDIIDKQFDAVVKKWTTIGIEGGAYKQTKDRIAVDINAKNANGYTAFKVYWEKIQYVRRAKKREKSHVSYRRYWHQEEHEYKYEDRDQHPTPEIDRDEEEVQKWFRTFYENILKWEELGADMSTASEDGICPLLTYVDDIKNVDISMETIKRLCPIEGVSVLDMKKETQYELIDIDGKQMTNESKEFFVDRTIRQSAFSKWWYAHNNDKKLFDVGDILIWHELGACADIQKLNVLKTYLEKCELVDQKTQDVDALIKCGCDVKNAEAEQFPSRNTLPLSTIIDKIFGLGKVNLDIVEYLLDVYDVPIETHKHPNFADVTNPEDYDTQLSTYIRNHPELTVENIQRLMKKGYLLKRPEEDHQKFIRSAVRNRKLPFDVFVFLLDSVEPDENDEDAKNAIEGAGILDCAIFNSWIQFNENITFEQIKTLIDKYKFSPYQSSNNTDCAIHYIWRNSAIDFDVMHEFWVAFGEQKFGKFEQIFVGFLWYILRKRKLEKKEEIQKLEVVFKEYNDAIDEVTGNSWLHLYCENEHLEMEVLEYLCAKCSDQIQVANKAGDKPLHVLCQNKSIKIEHLEYFVVDLGISMTLANEAGFQPFQALHYLVDNKKVLWKKKDVEIMINKLKIDFETFRAGEVILYRLSKQSNFTIEALIHLYLHYKNKVDLNAFRSAKEMWKDKANGGGTTILLHLAERTLTPNQITRLTLDDTGVGLDITAKNNENTNILHILGTGNCSYYLLRAVGQLLRRAYGEDFVCDMPDKSGITPFQKWLKASGEYVMWYMNTFEVWESLGADITQNESDAAYNMLHHYSAGETKLLRLSYFRKLCFDAENPWLKEEQGYVKKKKKTNGQKGRFSFQVPLHARPVPDNLTLYTIYIKTACYKQQPVQIRVLEFFLSKKNEGVRVITDTTESPLWLYMRHKYIDLNVVKYMVEKLGCSVRPAPSDQIVFEYMNYLSNRDAIDWDLLDYFYELEDNDGNKIVDFKLKEKDYVTLLHKYCHQLDPERQSGQRYYNQRYYRRARRGSYSLIFNCDDFKKLIEKYDLKSIMKEENGANPTPAAHFYEHRANEIRPDIIACFTELGFDINEQVNNKTPLQHYCSARSTYIMKSIIRSFIADGGAKINDRIPGQQAPSMSQVIANTVAKKVFRMMVETFGVELINAKKRTQDVWWTFMENYGGVLPDFKALLSIYIDSKFEPIHLFHSDKKDGEKRMQWKLYHVNIDGINMEQEAEEKPDLKLKKNRKRLKVAKKYIGRIIYVTDARDSLFRMCRAIDARSYEDGQAKDIPQKWLKPVRFKEMIENMSDLMKVYKSFYHSMPGQKLARSLVIIDMRTVRAIQELITKRALTDDKGALKTMKDIKLRKNNSILMKYIETNHRLDILARDIDEMKSYGIDFELKNDSRMNALHIYCQLSKGILDKNVVQSLINGGCPINWAYEKEKKKDDDDDSDDEDDEKDSNIVEKVLDIVKKKQKREYVRGDFTPLHHYCQLEESDLKGFKLLVDCGADVQLDSKQNVAAIYYILRHSHNITEAFVEFLSGDQCNINFNRQLSSGWSLFNFFLKNNAEITTQAVNALCEIADCDANSRDDENDTNSLKAYVKNEKRKFDFQIIKTLVELGADINEPDNDGVYPIQYALQIKYTPLSILMKYARNMIECGAKLQHILADDPLSFEDNKLYILQQMKDGYEMYDGSWCRIESWSWGRKKKQKLQCAVALDKFGATKLFIRIERQNLIDITQQMLIAKYPDFASLSAEHQEEEDDDDDVITENKKIMHHDVIEEEAP